MGYAYALIYGAAAIAGFSAFAGVVRAYFARVAADGGTTVDKQHAQEIYDDTNPYDPTLIQSCDSGKATALYSLLVNPQALLETFTGSAAAYSLRSLSSSTTNVVKVRRSGDDAELDFTATEVSDGTLAAWVTAGGGTQDGFVTTWYDQSGNGYNATQATAANQPKIVSSGSLVTENGKAALDFDGSNDQLSIGDISLYSNTNGQSIFSVFNARSVLSGIVGKYLVSSSEREFAMTYSASGLLQYTTQSNPASFNGAQLSELSISVNTQYIASGIWNPSVATNLKVNGGSLASAASAAPSMTDTTQSVLIGSSNNERMDGVIQELIIYPSEQSAKRTGIEGNINDYYNIYP